jgi:hypothetical protein
MFGIDPVSYTFDSRLKQSIDSSNPRVQDPGIAILGGFLRHLFGPKRKKETHPLDGFRRGIREG